jgi:hypothetical protein
MAKLWIDGQWVDKSKPVPIKTKVVKPEEPIFEPIPPEELLEVENAETVKVTATETPDKPKRIRTKKEQV